MNLEAFRSLLYPIGFVANLLFGGRFFLQWIQSEKKKESVVSRAFWRISLSANLLMCLHGYIQLQYPICLIQTLNAALAWRNLNLMGKKICSLKATLAVMASSALCLTLLFFLQGNSEWMRSPTLPWSGGHAAHADIIWHVVGFLGMVLFASRYWIQWWFAEKHKKSFLGKSFWWISCFGALVSFAYALRLHDPVNIIGFSVGLIPYVRNLMLIKRKHPQPPQSKTLFLFAGEQSGDQLGGGLIRSLKHISPTLHFYGVGGPEMQEAGLTTLHPMQRFQVMGFSDVLKNLPRLYSDFKKIRNEILQNNPLGVILIDYPDFNMLLAKSLRKKGYKGKVVHYVCPSVWAWRKNRIHTLSKTLDHLLAILPFEKNCFANTPLPVTYVGHPLVAAIDQYQYDPEWKTFKPLIAIFPGSRRHEITINLPLQIAAAKKLGEKYTLAVSVARPDLQELIKTYSGENVILVPAHKRYELMRAADGAIATSGTIVLELGLHSIPTVITYRLERLNYLLGRYAFRIHLPFYTLVNIICGKEVYPEFIHKDLSADAISQKLKSLIEHPENCQKECARLRELLTNQDANQIAASTIQELLA